MNIFDQIKGMSDEDACALLGTTLDKVEADAARYEADDTAGWQFGAPIEGTPELLAAVLRATSVKLYDHELKALDNIAAREGISRSALIRRAIDRELIALA
ncbi:CopG family transcriptional regulator [Actinomyces trachealis]|uniref:ribbon-helix-helix domain-containing protein n=1 Tax=Actinomyces trachealis TaxID=2763540 RepID=UPI0018C62854|nr:CopG family transcriptional regulator [Actinomyces trachealis]